MANDLNKLGILGIQDGALFARIQEAFQQVMANINDPRMDATKKRTLTITIAASCPNETTKEVKIETNVNVKLVTQSGIKTNLFNYEKQNSKGDKIYLLQEKTDRPIGQIDLEGNINTPLEFAYDYDKSIVKQIEKPTEAEKVIVDDTIELPKNNKGVFKTL